MLNLFCVPRNLFSSAGCVASDTALLCLCVCISVLCPSHFCVKRPFFPLPRCCMVWNPGTPPDLVDRTAALVVGADLALPSIKVLRPHLLPSSIAPCPSASPVSYFPLRPATQEVLFCPPVYSILGCGVQVNFSGHRVIYLERRLFVATPPLFLLCTSEPTVCVRVAFQAFTGHIRIWPGPTSFFLWPPATLAWCILKSSALVLGPLCLWPPDRFRSDTAVSRGSGSAFALR